MFVFYDVWSGLFEEVQKRLKHISLYTAEFLDQVNNYIAKLNVILHRLLLLLLTLCVLLLGHSETARVQLTGNCLAINFWRSWGFISVVEDTLQSRQRYGMLEASNHEIDDQSLLPLMDE